MRFRDGVPEAPLAEVGPAPAWPAGTDRQGSATGTEITFLPSPQTFTKTEFDFTTLEHRLRELAFLNSGVTLVLSDLREVEPKSRDAALRGRARSLCHAISTAPSRRCTRRRIAIRGERDGILLEIAMEWTDSYHETMLCFTNTIPQRDGGTHLAGFRAALTRTVNAYANDSGIAKKEKVALTGEDMREGLDLHPLGQGARPEILLADQGQAGLLRGPSGDRGHRRRPAARNGSRSIRPTPERSSPRSSRRRRRARRRARRAT